MPLSFVCPACEEECYLEYEDMAIGYTFDCSNCGAPLVIEDIIVTPVIKEVAP